MVIFFALEFFIVELESAAAIDPIDFRLADLDEGRAKFVLREVRRKA